MGHTTELPVYSNVLHTLMMPWVCCVPLEKAMSMTIPQQAGNMASFTASRRHCIAFVRGLADDSQVTKSSEAEMIPRHNFSCRELHDALPMAHLPCAHANAHLAYVRTEMHVARAWNDDCHHNCAVDAGDDLLLPRT
mmetsp:Transcript_22340/g.60365  ORF Transcript_22340/g.60365 Transcript_22340/m.60365 type:complete len:137 (-) Transcript_22340:63-473(-)